MKKNFLITDAVAVQIENDHCDLHNDFDLALFEVNLAKKCLRLTFTRSSEAAIKNRNYYLALLFSEVDYLNVSNGVLGKMVSDIVEIGYKSPDDVDHDWLMKESQASPADHLFFRLAGDQFIRVHSKFALAQFENFAVN